MTVTLPPPRVAFLIPHYFGGTDDSAVHGSNRPRTEPIRRALLDRVIFQLHALFGATHHAFSERHSRIGRVEDESTLAAYSCPNLHRLREFEVYVFTTRGQHLLAGLKSLTPRHYRHVATEADPPFLGFECARWIRDHPDGYDFYCYLEDDIILRDPLFFAKIAAFNQAFDAAGRGLVVQPQRYEEPLNAGDPEDIAKFNRLYIDYEARGDEDAQAAPASAGETLALDFAGLRVEFEPARNPHAGCYVVTPAQAARMTGHPDFLSKDKVFINPLDTAATGFVARALKVYKPARNSLAFLDVQHGHQGILRVPFA
jgi:hypothetical protein